MTTTVEQTLNVTVAQIEDALLAGQTVPDFAREWSEPPANVLAVFRRLQNEGRIPTNAPSQVAKTPGAPVPGSRPPASVPSRPAAQSDALPSVGALAGAAARSTSKRTQTLGVKLLDLANVVLQRLADERETAEKAEQNRRERERELAAAEVARLEEALRAARQKLGPHRKNNVSEAGRANIRANAMKGQQAGAVESPCRKGCGFVAKSRAGRAGHERHCGGAS